MTRKNKNACAFCREPSQIITYTCGWCGRVRYFLLTPIDDLPESETTELVIPTELMEQVGELVYD